MAKDRLNITILTDETSWMNLYDRILVEKLEACGHYVEIVHSKGDIKYGDVAFFLSCFEIVDHPFLMRNKHNIVVHASELPKGKGWSPASWQILSGINDIPLTMFEATAKMDAGDVYLRDVVHLDGSELIDEWQHKLGLKIVDMCCKFIEHIVNGKMVAIPQCGVETFYPKRMPKDSKLDINKSLVDQFNLLRVVDNEKYPAFFELGGHKYKIFVSKDAIK